MNTANFEAAGWMVQYDKTTADAALENGHVAKCRCHAQAAEDLSDVGTLVKRSKPSGETSLTLSTVVECLGCESHTTGSSPFSFLLFLLLCGTVSKDIRAQPTDAIHRPLTPPSSFRLPPPSQNRSAVLPLVLLHLGGGVLFQFQRYENKSCSQPLEAHSQANGHCFCSGR